MVGEDTKQSKSVDKVRLLGNVAVSHMPLILERCVLSRDKPTTHRHYMIPLFLTTKYQILFDFSAVLLMGIRNLQFGEVNTWFCNPFIINFLPETSYFCFQIAISMH